MDYFQDDIATEFTPIAKKNKRLKELKFLIENYVKLANSSGIETLRVENKSVLYLNSHYWECLESQVRCRMLPHDGNDGRRVDRHKVASATEIMTMAAMPIESVGGDDECQLITNAKLAYSLGLMIIGNFNKDVIQSMYVSQSFVDQHLIWLCDIRASMQFDFFSNAATWYLVERLFIERHQSIDNSLP